MHKPADNSGFSLSGSNMPISFIFAYACPVTQRYRQKRVWKVCLLATMWKYGRFTQDSTCPYDWWVTVKRWITLYFQCCLTFYRTFWSGATTDRYLHCSGERNGEQRRTRGEWVSEWVSQWVSESVSQWVSESVSHWVSRLVSRLVGRSVGQ